MQHLRHLTAPAVRGRYPLTMTLLLMAGAAVAMMLLSGCNTGGSSSIAAANAAFKQTGATYVGKGRCNDCHASIMTDFAGTVHGQNFRNLNGENLITMSNGACLPCHTQGFGSPSGYDDKTISATQKTALEGIGCENCHGPGSKHAASLSKADITLVPPDKATCWSCHDPGYKMFDNPSTIPVVNDASLRATVPGSVKGPNHAQTIMLMGYEVANTAPTPSPHSTMPGTCMNCHYRSDIISPVNGKVDHSQANLLPNVADRGTRAACTSCHAGDRSGGHRGANGRLEANPLQDGIQALCVAIGGAAADGVTPDSTMSGGLLAAFATKHAISLTTNAAPDDPNVKIYKVARYNLAYVLSDKSLGVHNPGLATKMLQDAQAALSN